MPKDCSHFESSCSQFHFVEFSIVVDNNLNLNVYIFHRSRSITICLEPESCDWATDNHALANKLCTDVELMFDSTLLTDLSFR